MSGGTLVSLAIGPVQDFIAQARRSRDLWSGSVILSEITKAAARALIAVPDADLIFPPFMRGDSALSKADGPLDAAGSPVQPISNKVLARLPAGVDVSSALVDARNAAIARWREIAASVLGGPADAIVPSSVRPGARDDAWTEQVDGLLELYGAALPLRDDSPAAFDAARLALDEALAARKSIRDFAQQKAQRRGAPKSSLDGGRVSVLPDRDDRAKAPAKSTLARYRIPASEALDAVGVVKRCWGKPDQFTPVANVAIAQWIDVEGTDPTVRQRLDEIAHEAREFGTLDRKLPHGKQFSADAQCLYPDRIRTMMEELGYRGQEAQAEADRFVEAWFEPLQAAWHSPPPSYVAVLVADGDYMGALIDASSRAGGASTVHTLSERLNAFAVQARSIVQTHRGSLLYSGGDDVVAFLPVGTALACAEALRQAFAGLMQPLAPKAGGQLPTLSVGVGLGHFLTGMGALLDLARDAEQQAKGSERPGTEPRDALAVVVDKRSGARVSWRAKWAGAGSTLQDAVQRLASGVLPGTKLYQVRDILQRLPAAADVPAGDPDTASWVAALAGDVLRTLSRSEQTGGGVSTLSGFGLPAPLGQTYPEALAAVDRWIRLHIVAKEIQRNTFALPAPATLATEAPHD